MKTAGRILFLAPLPPPFAGPEIASEMLLETLEDIDHPFDIIHVQSNIREENLKKGIFDVEGVFSFLRVYRTFVRRILFSKIGLVYLLLSSGKVGFARDAVLIFTARALGKKVWLIIMGATFITFTRKRPVGVGG